MMQYLDKSPYIVSWAYEPRSIKYLDKSSCPPRVRRYFIDFTAVVKAGPVLKTVWLEVKPYCESCPPKPTAKPEAKLLWLKNSCKWSAASEIAKSRGYEFHVITEKQLS